METMPYREPGSSHHLDAPPRVAPLTGGAAITTTDWRSALPVLRGATVTLRELRPSDAASLLALLTTEEVSRFISPPPASVAGFERFIAWTHAQRRAGHYACFAVVPRGSATAIGIFQLRALDSGFGIAEWGFAIGSPYWGTGVFAEGAALLLAFAFNEVGITRLEARASVHNGRGNGALRKVGAVAECRLRQSFVKDGERHDQVLWGLLASEWRERQAFLLRAGTDGLASPPLLARKAAQPVELDGGGLAVEFGRAMVGTRHEGGEQRLTERHDGHHGA